MTVVGRTPLLCPTSLFDIMPNKPSDFEKLSPTYHFFILV